MDTLTTDNGREFAQHERIANKLDADFFFAHPYSSRERGANENMNGLIRQLFPKKMAFEFITTNDVELAIHQLNHRPRKCLGYTAVEYARFADDIVVLVDAHPRHAWLKEAVPKRLRQELTKLQVKVNEEKIKTVDLAQGESFGFLGFDFRRVRSLAGKWRPKYTPKLKKRTELLERLRKIFRSHQSQPVSWVIDLSLRFFGGG